MKQVLADLEKINTRLSAIEHNQRVILCCSVLPKGGPNWDFYEDLFKHAEAMIIKERKGLHDFVEEILEPTQAS